MTRPAYLAAIVDLAWLIGALAALAVALPFVPPPMPLVLVALAAVAGLALWVGLGIRVQRRGGRSGDVWRAVWRVLVLNLLVGVVSQVAMLAAGQGSTNLAAQAQILGPLAVLLYVVALPIGFVLGGMVFELVALVGYGLAELLLSSPMSSTDDERAPRQRRVQAELERLRRQTAYWEAASERLDRGSDVSPSPLHRRGGWRRVAAVLAVAIVLWLAGHAAGLNAPPAPGPAAAPATSAMPMPTPAPADAPAIATPYVPPLPGALRNYTGLDDFVTEAQAQLDDYWRHRPFPARHPYATPRVVLWHAGDPTPCGPSGPVTTSFECGMERTIVMDAPAWERANSWAGYAGLYQALAHEWTHHVQSLLGVSTRNGGLDIELGADCGSGLFMAAAWPDMAQSDLDALRRLLLSTPSDAVHGTPEQRLAAFDAGYWNGATASCGLPLAAWAPSPAAA
jgi:hypothetical protein